MRTSQYAHCLTDLSFERRILLKPQNITNHLVIILVSCCEYSLPAYANLSTTGKEPAFQSLSIEHLIEEFDKSCQVLPVYGIVLHDGAQLASASFVVAIENAHGA